MLATLWQHTLLLWLYYHVWIHFSHSPYNVWCMYSKQKHTNRPLMLLLRLVLLFAHISCVERRWKRMRNNFHLEAQRQINPLFNILSAWLCHSLPELFKKTIPHNKSLCYATGLSLSFLFIVCLCHSTVWTVLK